MLPASDVLQMESFTGATPVPGAPPHVAGLVQIRGQGDCRSSICGRASAAARSSRTLDNRVVVIDQRAARVGLLVDSAREVVKLAAERSSRRPTWWPSRPEGFVKAVAQVGQAAGDADRPRATCSTQEDANVEQRQV